MNVRVILLLLISAFIFRCGSNRNKKKMENIREFKVVELSNANGVKIKITNFGGSVMSILVPDKHGEFGEIVLGYDTPEEYIDGNLYFGALIGRYGNRIAKGRFTLEGKNYKLARNNGQNHLHGGIAGYNNMFWEILSVKPNTVELFYLSKDGEEGYPGNLKVWVTYSLTDDNELVIDYKAETDQTTIVNLTHHSFFNLKDAGKSPITEHLMQINADAFTPVDEGLIPTGEIRKVENTPMDFRKMIPVGERINNMDEQLAFGKGYDHNWVLKKINDSLTFAAGVYEPLTGRTLEVFTTEPGLQFYSGNFLDGTDVGHNGVQYNFRTAFCLEAQHFPDSPNHITFPSTILKPGEKYTQKTIYKFGIKNEKPDAG